MAKKKAKRKQPTEAELKQMQLDDERELQEEADLLPRLAEAEKNLRIVRSNEIAADVVNLLGDLETLIRMFKRKHSEARELKEHLIGLKEFFEKGWDEEDQHFDVDIARDHDLYVSGHWCSNLIEEIGAMTEEGTVYTALPLSVSDD